MRNICADRRVMRSGLNFFCFTRRLVRRVLERSVFSSLAALFLKYSSAGSEVQASVGAFDPSGTVRCAFVVTVAQRISGYISGTQPKCSDSPYTLCNWPLDSGGRKVRGHSPYNIFWTVHAHSDCILRSCICCAHASTRPNRRKGRRSISGVRARTNIS